MKVVLNGTATELATGATVADVLVSMGRGAEAKGVAVAVNGSVVPKGHWSEKRLADDDRIEVLTAVGGG